MRLAKRHELQEQTTPVLTAQVSELELHEWFPEGFVQIDDPEATPEPSKGALFKLKHGSYFVAFWGEYSKQLTIRIPSATSADEFFDAFLREVPLPQGRILWCRGEIADRRAAQ